MKKLFSKISIFNLVNTFAFMLLVQSVNATCLWEIYQPELPEGAKRFVK